VISAWEHDVVSLKSLQIQPSIDQAIKKLSGMNSLGSKIGISADAGQNTPEQNESIYIHNNMQIQLQK
jgi:hypothetical protein